MPTQDEMDRETYRDLVGFQNELVELRRDKQLLERQIIEVKFLIKEAQEYLDGPDTG